MIGLHIWDGAEGWGWGYCWIPKEVLESLCRITLVHTVACLSLRGSQTQSWKPAVDVEPLPLVVRGNEEGGSGLRVSHTFWQHSGTPRKIPVLLPKAKRWDSAPSSPRGSSPRGSLCWAGSGQAGLCFSSAPPPNPPRPQTRQAGSQGLPDPDWPFPRVARAARVKNCSAAGGGDLSPPASATSTMPAAVPSLTLTLPAPKEQWNEWCPSPKRVGAAPLPAQGSFRHSTDTSWQNCCQLGLQCLDLVLPNW